MQIHLFHKEEEYASRTGKCGQKGPENRCLTKKKAALFYHANINEGDNVLNILETSIDLTH